MPLELNTIPRCLCPWKWKPLQAIFSHKPRQRDYFTCNFVHNVPARAPSLSHQSQPDDRLAHSVVPLTLIIVMVVDLLILWGSGCFSVWWECGEVSWFSGPFILTSIPPDCLLHPCPQSPVRSVSTLFWNSPPNHILVKSSHQKAVNVGNRLGINWLRPCFLVPSHFIKIKGQLKNIRWGNYIFKIGDGILKWERDKQTKGMKKPFPKSSGFVQWKNC